MNRSPEQEATALLADALRKDALAQDAGDVAAVGDRYDDVYQDVLALCEDLSGRAADGFLFWDWWCDARNHDWKYYYEGIARDDWPRLARHIADAIEQDLPITEPVLVKHFERAARPGLFARLRRWIGGDK